MLGSGVSANGRPDAFRSLICQMPSQVVASFLFLKPTYCESWATFLGLYPFLMTSTIQVSALTPWSESKVALAPSGAYGSPPFCHSSDRNIRWAGQRLGIQNGCGTVD